MKKYLGIFLVMISTIISVASIYISSQRDLTSLENTLFQLIILAIGLLGSYVIGRESTKESAKELIKPHARSAFRRLLSLYSSLSRLAGLIKDSKHKAKEDSPMFMS
jgi:hypothetical protein